MQLFSSGPALQEGQVRALQGPKSQDDVVLLVGLGQKGRDVESHKEGHDLTREAVRIGISSAVRSLKDHGIEEVLIDDCGDAEASAEGANLALWSFDQLKAKKETLKNLQLKSLSENVQDWQSGLAKAQGQNLARTLMETPANHLTPEKFALKAKEELEGSGVEVIARDLQWIKDQKMGSFLSVSQGSAENPIFLEMSYNQNPDQQPIQKAS